MLKLNKGQSVIELLVVVGAMSLLMVALLSLVVLSIRNSRLSKDRTQAVTLAQEGIELMRAYRDYSWSGIWKKAPDEGDESYRLEKNWTVETDLVETDCDESTPMSEDEIDNNFSRCVVISKSEDESEENIIIVEVRVSWKEGTHWHKVNQATKLSLWER